MEKVTIYTDGSCLNSVKDNRVGGWAFVIIDKDGEREYSGKLENASSNRAEMTAAIRGLSSLKSPSNVDLYSDSAYLVNCFIEKWYIKWQKNGWINSRRVPVENRDLWEELIMLSEVHNVNFLKVKGHANDKLNNRCDKLAGEARKS